MKIEMTDEDVKVALEAWVREKMRVTGPIEVYQYGQYPGYYTVQTDPALFLARLDEKGEE